MEHRFIDQVPCNFPPCPDVYDSNKNREGLSLMRLLVVRNKCLPRIVTIIGSESLDVHFKFMSTSIIDLLKSKLYHALIQLFLPWPGEQLSTLSSTFRRPTPLSIIVLRDGHSFRLSVITKALRRESLPCLPLASVGDTGVSCPVLQT